MASGAVYKKQAQMMSKKASLQGLFSWLIFFDFSCHRSRLLVFRQMFSDCREIDSHFWQIFQNQILVEECLDLGHRK